ncbi:hypothetical protein ERICIV_00205 [Paenibacillus larvae subsp. larvae]|uniref:Uncharacterized protein n=1 Tax=Paenibacillus larvae subsp. larvae TaxID=147375 RepID=A0A2L1TUY1_9BACL|nr:hypothetical protein B1222_13440 [Paenibacillus larvae subsp. pulvifaciens]AQZ47174.1 hypothetical protein B5S25_11830 [Paenibacillus larvae subsp. pulvifaciens]AVF24465.1 hypothetical protein ERICIII_00205 [Paenibacillus larvae subsp. larvae]AVF29226.1 hypothetical protein ERICIV_00205 [Paenibacillus larvae subsp. larvae]MBH0342629.1 hypothetical protein [Paenibacillus larvae]
MLYRITRLHVDKGGKRIGIIVGFLFFMISSQIFSDYTMHETNGWITFISTSVLMVIAFGITDFIDKRMKKDKK